MLQQTCPCGQPTEPRDGDSGPVVRAYDACCGRLHRGTERAATAEELMRSRYSAFVLGLDAYVFATWHPRTRPDDVRTDPGTRWTGLEILDRIDGEPDDETGEVEFVARWQGGEMRERSRFGRRAGRWMYVDGDVS